MSKYSGMNDHDILVIVAEATDRHEQHLAQINSTLSKHELKLMKIETRREIEESMGYQPPSKKRKVFEGSMYGGMGALIVSVLYTIGHYAGIW